MICYISILFVIFEYLNYFEEIKDEVDFLIYENKFFIIMIVVIE